MPQLPWVTGGIRLIKMLVELHRRGLQRLRIYPYEYPIAWRMCIEPRSNFSGNGLVGTGLEESRYSSGQGLNYFGWSDVENSDAEQLAGEFMTRFPRVCEAGAGRDWEYAGWLSELSGHVSRTRALPFVHAENFEPEPSKLTYLPLRAYDADNEVSKFPLPPLPNDSNPDYARRIDELKRDVDELQAKIVQARASLKAASNALS